MRYQASKSSSSLIESDLLNLSEQQLNEKFAECSQLNPNDSALVGDVTEDVTRGDMEHTTEQVLEVTTEQRTEENMGEDVENPLNNIK